MVERRSPKVTVNEEATALPSEQVIQPVTPIVVMDGKRRITLQKPGVLAQFRLVKVLGAAADNQTYVGMLLPLLYVATVDGEPVYPAQSETEIEALIQRLDESGLAVVMRGVEKHFGSNDAEADKTAVKK